MTFLLWVCEAHCLPRAAGAEVLRSGCGGAQGAGSRSRGARSGPCCLWQKACAEPNTFRLINEGQPVAACGPFPSAWALLRPTTPLSGTALCVFPR